MNIKDDSQVTLPELKPGGPAGGQPSLAAESQASSAEPIDERDAQIVNELGMGESEMGQGIPSADREDAAASAVEVVDPVLEERDRLKEQLLRMAADFDNFRKRTRRDLQEAGLRGREEALRELLPVFDGLERALSAAKEAKEVKSIAEGVSMVLKLFEDVGDRMNLKRLRTVGERFDPAIHDAIQQFETAEHPPGTIIAEIAAGYKLGERLLRPALVVVARMSGPSPVPATKTPAPASGNGAGSQPGDSEPSASGENTGEEAS